MKKKTKKTRYVKIGLEVVLVLNEPVVSVKDVFDKKLLREVASLAILLFMDGRGVKTNKAGKATATLQFPKRPKRPR